MLNSEKMSKSTGNFRTLRQAIEDFSADATRFSIADAGDGMDDANFVTDTADAAILRLTQEISWMEKVLAEESSLRKGSASTYADKVFENEINIAVSEAEKQYKGLMFREALKVGFYDLQAARDDYRVSCNVGGMNGDLVWRFMDVQTRLITPICPHYAEYVWREVLKKDGFVINAGWPNAGLVDHTLKKANKYLQDLIVDMRKKVKKPGSGSKKGTALIYVNEQYDGWKEACLKILQSKFNSETKTFASDDQEILGELRRSVAGPGEAENLKFLEKCMAFMRYKKREAVFFGCQAIDLKLLFGEKEVLEENLEIIKSQLCIKDVQVLSVSDDGAIDRAGPHAKLLRDNLPSPGKPTVILFSTI